MTSCSGACHANHTGRAAETQGRQGVHPTPGRAPTTAPVTPGRTSDPLESTKYRAYRGWWWLVGGWWLEDGRREERRRSGCSTKNQKPHTSRWGKTDATNLAPTPTPRKAAVTRRLWPEVAPLAREVPFLQHQGGRNLDPTPSTRGSNLSSYTWGNWGPEPSPCF